MSTARASTDRRSGIPAADGARLLISLPQIAALAKVRRPVVSVWRTRFNAGSEAFPAAVDLRAGREYFNAHEVADWLVETSHGNNPDAVADVVAFATDNAGDSKARRYDAIEALLALRVLDGDPLASSDLAARAQRTDPRDEALLSEIGAVAEDTALTEFTEQLIDAAYSPVGAWDAVQSQRPTLNSVGAAGSISPVGADLIARIALSLAETESIALVDPVGDLSTAGLFATAAERADDSADLHVPASNRRLRRRLMVHGRSPMLTTKPPHPTRPAVWIARLRGVDAESELAQLEDILLDLSDTQRLVVVGPESVLIAPLSGPAETSREYVLRSGRVRGIVRLPAGLVPTATRQSLALWVIGGPQGGMPLADRFTVIGDLQGAILTPARMQDLVNDLAVSLGTVREAMSHAFRFVRFVRTSMLLAGGTSLVAASNPHDIHMSASPAELAAMADEALADLDDPALALSLQAPSSAQAHRVSLSDAVAAGEARLLSGARLHSDDTLADDGYPVMGRDEVRTGTASARRIDRVRVAVGYPRAQLTLPGDVIVTTGSTPAAFVDRDGSSVVEYPARILRLLDETLVPEVIAADINSYLEPVPWKRWSLRRIPAGQKIVLQASLAEILAARRAAEDRMDKLRELETRVMDAVAAGALIREQPEMTSEMTEPEGTI